MKPRVAVLFNAPVLPNDHPDYESEVGVVSAARAVLRVLQTHGFRPFLLAARPPVQRFVNRLVKTRPDLVFNLIEGFGGRSEGEIQVTSILEMMGVPFTGCPSICQALGRHKALTKRLLLGSDMPTACFRCLEPHEEFPESEWDGPVIVKPECEDASLGITQDSIVTDPADLPSQIQRLRETYGSRVLIESYLPGPEFNLGVLALPLPQALPAAEIVYIAKEGRWPILTYEAKWNVGSEADLASLPRCPAQIDDSLARRLSDLAVRAFQICGCRDYARIDFRLDSQGNPMILEVNPNPDLDPKAGLSRAIEASGRDWGETVATIARLALDRGSHRG